MSYAPKSHPKQAPVTPWCNVLPVHPAAKLLPRMSQDELRELGEDIKRRGLQSPIAIFTDEEGTEWLLDGINRLEAMELVGLEIVIGGEINPDIPTQTVAGNVDPHTYVLSANLYRRHLTNEQKRELIGKLLELKPNLSNRQIAEMTRSSHPTVADVRVEKERRGKISTSKTRTDSKGREQPARKQKAAKPAKPDLTPAVDEEEAPIEAPAPKITFISQDGIESHLDALIGLVEDDQIWPNPTAGRKARRAAVLKKLCAVKSELIELAKPAPRRGRPAKVEHTGVEA